MWLFHRIARSQIPVAGPLLPALSRAANHSRLWLAIAAVLGLVGGRRQRRAALRGTLALGATSALTNLPAKLLAGRRRPDLDVVPRVRRLARVPASTSFPSGHSASAFAFATAVSMEQPRLRAPLLTLAGAVAVSRVYTGVHYPGDVLAGAAIGVTVARATRRPWPLGDVTPATGTVAGSDVSRPRADGGGVVVVTNVDAGSALAADPAERLRSLLPEARLLLRAEAGEELTHLLRRAATEATVLAVAGGDGSVSAGCAAAAEAGVPLLVVPAGTLNHLAKDLGIENVDDAARTVREGTIVAADLGEVDGRTFVNAASVGAYPHLVAVRERWEHRIGKWPALLWALLHVLRRDPFELEIDGRRRRVWFVFVGNGRFTDDPLAPNRRRRLDDGVLDVRLIDAEVRMARTQLVLSLLLGRLSRCAAYERWLADGVRIRSLDGPMRLAGDGETWQGPEEVAVRKRPAALWLLHP